MLQSESTKDPSGCKDSGGGLLSWSLEFDCFHFRLKLMWYYNMDRPRLSNYLK